MSLHRDKGTETGDCCPKLSEASNCYDAVELASEGSFDDRIAEIRTHAKFDDRQPG